MPQKSALCECIIHRVITDAVYIYGMTFRFVLLVFHRACAVMARASKDLNQSDYANACVEIINYHGLVSCKFYLIDTSTFLHDELRNG